MDRQAVPVACGEKYTVGHRAKMESQMRQVTHYGGLLTGAVVRTRKTGGAQRVQTSGDAETRARETHPNSRCPAEK